VKIQETRIKIQEVSKDLQMGRILFQKYRGKLFEDEDRKMSENQRLGPEERQNAPRAWKNAWGMNLAIHVPRA